VATDIRYGDPFAIVWDGLAQRNFGPRGQVHNFRSRCPLHGDNDTSLHVWDRGDGVVELHCHARDCERDEIMEALGLGWRDRYPLGYYSDTTRKLTPAKRGDFTGTARDPVDIWLAASRLGIRWVAHLWLDECPNCGWAYFSLAVGSEREPSMRCPRGCTLDMVRHALADRLSEQRRHAA
jgi:hypothetical protein